MGDLVKPAKPPGDASVDSLGETYAGQEPAAAEPSPGSGPRSIGRFVVLRPLGQGGMGVVYAAYDEELDRKIAIKLLHQSELKSLDRRTRILREAQAMARVSHPNAVQIYEVGEVAGQVFIAMEYIEGTTLGSWQEQRGRAWEEILRMYVAAGQGLLAAHAVGLVHRDFKPDNVLVGADQRPRVADFGLARATGSVELSKSVEDLNSARLLSSPLTLTGMLLGTPAYMSPEQYRGETADSRSDQFSFCAALYEALYKKLPFSGTTIGELSSNILDGKIQPVDPESPIPGVIEQVLRRGLARQPEQRFASMAELLAMLSIDPQHDPTGSPRARRRFSFLLLATCFVISVIFNMKQAHKNLGVDQFLTASLILLAGWLAAAVITRKTLGQNSFHRHVLKMIGTIAAQMVAFRLLAVLLHLELAQLAAVELMGLSVTMLIISTQFLSSVWPMSILLAAGSLLLTQRRDLLWPVMPVLYPIMGLWLVWAWSGAAKHVRPTHDRGAP